MIIRVSRARLRRDRKDGAFEFPRRAASSGDRDSTVEHFETIAERYEDLAAIGLDPGTAS